jgi:AbrB family looped-hinge helix DNA binding protein
MKSNKSMTHEHSILGMVSVNEKGQVVIPIEARTLMGLEPGDKLIVIAHPTKSGVLLMKPDGLEAVAKSMLAKLSDVKAAYRE